LHSYAKQRSYLFVALVPEAIYSVTRKIGAILFDLNEYPQAIFHTYAKIAQKLIANDNFTSLN